MLPCPIRNRTFHQANTLQKIIMANQTTAAGTSSSDDQPGWNRLWGLLPPPKPRVGTEDIAIFTRQLSTMISAGIPLMESLDVLAQQQEDPGFERVLNEIVDEVRSGEDFSTALSNYPNQFAKIYVSMAEAGEASGNLDTVLTRLAEYMESAEQLKREIKSAMTYPVISLFLIVGIAMGLMVFIVPKFKKIFESIGGGMDLPAITQFTLAVSMFLQTNFWYVVIGAIALYGIWYFYTGTDIGEWHWHWFLLKVPIFGSLFRKVAIARFAQTYATLIRSGVPILGALEITAETSGNRVIEDAVLESREEVRQGEHLGPPLEETGVFPIMVTKMIEIGEEAGALEELLEKISEFYNQQVEATVNQLTSLIEPILISFMGIIVGGIVLAIFLPILNIQSAVQS